MNALLWSSPWSWGCTRSCVRNHVAVNLSKEPSKDTLIWVQCLELDKASDPQWRDGCSAGRSSPCGYHTTFPTVPFITPVLSIQLSLRAHCPSLLLASGPCITHCFYILRPWPFEKGETQPHHNCSALVLWPQPHMCSFLWLVSPPGSAALHGAPKPCDVSCVPLFSQCCVEASIQRSFSMRKAYKDHSIKWNIIKWDLAGIIGL